jgi:ATP-binding cassette, subfamily B, bacterial
VFVFATVLTMRLGQSLNQLANAHVNVVGSMALFRRLFQVIDNPPEIGEQPDAQQLGAVHGAVSFEHVTFAYQGSGRPALDDVTFDMQPGQLVALVGPSGAGKTTITSLVPRFYDPQQGSVTIDGHDVRDVTLSSLGENLGIVFQDTFLFHASIRENLLYARPDASEDELESAVRDAHLHEFIHSLPDGYETIVGERGHRLLVLDKGRIIERGSHHELLERDGLYATLYEHQFRTVREVDELLA